jgi:hypothetical protein
LSRSCRPTAAAALAALLAAGAARGQAPATTNEIAGRIGFSNSNPAILSVLGAPTSAGLHSVTLTAVALAPAFPASYAADVVLSDPVNAAQSITVGADAAGITYSVQAAALLGSGPVHDEYYFLPVTSPPVVEDPAPDTPLDIIECAGLIRVHFVDDVGMPLAVQGDRVTASSSLGGTSPLGHVGASSTTKDLVVRGDGSTYSVRVEITFGSDPFVDRVYVERSGSVVVGCDEIVDLPVVVPTPASGQQGRIIGRADVLGENEVSVATGIPAQQRTRVEANGPWRNLRADQIAGTPSQGDFALENLLASDVENPPVPWSLYAESAFIDPEGFCSFRTPERDVLLGAGQEVDVGDAFVLQPVTVTGNLLLAGPPRDPVLGSPLEDLFLSTSRDGNRDGVPDDLSRLFDSTVVVGNGTSTIAPGASRSADGATCFGIPAGGFDPTTASFAGTWRLVLGNLDSEPGEYEADELNLKFVDQTDPLDPERFQDSRVDVDEPMPPWTLAASASASRDRAYCLSRVLLTVDSPAGAMFWPDFSGDGMLRGIDFRGQPVDYTAHAWWMRGLPNAVGRSAQSGTSLATLPQGTYYLTPSVRLVIPGGGFTMVTLAPFALAVGCRQSIRARPEVQVTVSTSLEPCPASLVVALEGSAHADAGLASVALSVNGGPDQLACAGCGTDTTFTLPATLSVGDNTLVVTATDTLSRTASVTSFARASREPSALDQRPGAQPLRVVKDPSGDLRLSWEAEPRDAFNIYRGTLASLHARVYDHLREGACGRPGSSALVPLPPGDAYFLVTGTCGSAETSYGRDSLGTERPAAADACF